MKLIKNEEIGSILEELTENILKYATCEKYNYVKLSQKDIEEYKKSKEKVFYQDKEFYDIPYNKNIKFDKIKNRDNIKLQKLTIKKNLLFMFDYPKFNERLEYSINYGAFMQDVHTFRLTENDDVYMSPTFMEYNTMKEPIFKAYGNCLTFGLGIGFYVYNVLEKEEVSKITVVEKNKNTIELFKKYILPQFPRKNDVEIIKGDLFDYCTDDFLSNYDYTFIDVHFNNVDGDEIYTKLLNKGVDFTKIDFWIEEQILDETRMAIPIYLHNLYRGVLAETLSHEGDMQKLFKSIHRVFRDEDVIIDTEEKVLKYVNNDDFVRKIMKGCM